MGPSVIAVEGYRPPQAEEVPLFVVLDAPAAIVIAETPEDEFDRARANRLVRTAEEVGPLALRGEVETAKSDEETRSAYPTFMHAIQAAAEGDPIARKLVEINAKTVIIEITLKTGHVTRIPIYVDANEKLVQYGQAMEDVHTNALIYASAEPKIRNRTLPEILNGIRMESAKRRGLLKRNYLVVFSRYIDGISDEDAAEYGLFPDTKSASIQAITEVSDQELVQETAFVAGVKQLGGERHDRETVAGIGRKLEINLEGLDDAETIDHAVLIPKELMPSGVIDIVKWWDEIAGGTFFGEAKTVQDYLAYARLCQEREQELEPTVQKVVEELLAEAGSITGPAMATERLHKLADAKLIRQAIADDRTINPRVFGPEAAAWIEYGREKHDQGDIKGAEEAADQAIELSTSSTCPAAREKTQKKEAKDKDSDRGTSEESETSETCIIMTKSCYCCSYNRDGTKRSSALWVKASIDEFKTIHCLRDGCGARLGEGGKDKYIGRIAKRAEQLERASQQVVAKATEQPEDAVVLQFPSRPNVVAHGKGAGVAKKAA